MDELDAVVDAARMGLGLTVMSADCILDDLRNGKLLRLLPNYGITGNTPEQSRIIMQYPAPEAAVTQSGSRGSLPVGQTAPARPVGMIAPRAGSTSRLHGAKKVWASSARSCTRRAMASMLDMLPPISPDS